MREIFRKAAAMALLMCIPGIAGCGKPEMPPQVLGDLAYSEDAPESQFTVLLPEGGEKVPYLVLTNNYADTGCALLLRKFVLPEPRIFNPNENYGSYYENSAVDRFLQEEFVQELGVSPETVPVEITAYDSLHGQGQDLTAISRQVFLLSALEAGCGSGRTFLGEGTALTCFEEEAHRVAYTEAGDAVTWWLRTPCAWYDNVVCCVNTEGVMVFCGLGGITDEDNRFFLRPALCLPADRKIVQNSKGVYELKEDIAG